MIRPLDEKVTLTSDSCGKSVTNAMKSSQPALRPIGLVVPRLRTVAPSLSALTSSNIVPTELSCNETKGIGRKNRSLSPLVCSTRSARASMAASGAETYTT